MIDQPHRAQAHGVVIISNQEMVLVSKLKKFVPCFVRVQSTIYSTGWIISILVATS